VRRERVCRRHCRSIMSIDDFVHEHQAQLDAARIPPRLRMVLADKILRTRTGGEDVLRASSAAGGACCYARACSALEDILVFRHVWSAARPDAPESLPEPNTPAAAALCAAVACTSGENAHGELLRRR
jgi:hypothetical protein